jgi:hypothetical protein
VARGTGCTELLRDGSFAKRARTRPPNPLEDRRSSFDAGLNLASVQS